MRPSGPEIDVDTFHGRIKAAMASLGWDQKPTALMRQWALRYKRDLPNRPHLLRLVLGQDFQDRHPQPV